MKQGLAIYHDLFIYTSLPRAYDAVSVPKRLVNWWPLKCTGIPELGGEYNFYFTPEYDWHGKVVDLKPDSSFKIKMTQADIDWKDSEFSFDMTENNGNIELQFCHCRWPEYNSHYHIASFCWAMLLKGLKDYLEKGIILPFEERS